MSDEDDYGEKKFPPLLEPHNLAPLVVMAFVGGLLALRAIAVTFGWLDPF